MSKNNGIVIVSPFDGMSCGHLAVDRAGIKVKLYMSSEICEPSIRITQYNYPGTLQLGDIRDINGRPLRGKVDLYFGGSPCQSFSNAGDRQGFDGKSRLFFEWLRLKNEIKPEYWLLENVMMKKIWRDYISKLLGVEAIYIDSSVVSGQRRPRLYWTNIPYTPIEDKGILLGDVIHGAVTGAGKHGKRIPEHLRTPGGYNWKNNGWEFNPDNKAYCMGTSRGHYRNTMGEVIGYTPEDAEALQTVPKGYTNVPGVADYKRFEALGNGWTVDVLVEAFFKNLPWASNINNLQSQKSSISL